MNRRQFLQTLGLVAPSAVLAPKYFFAPAGGWHKDYVPTYMRMVAARPPDFISTLPQYISTGAELDKLCRIIGIQRRPAMFPIGHPETDSELRSRAIASMAKYVIPA